jgi:microcystin-dependent protein
MNRTDSNLANINSKINFINRNTKYLNILPKYMVIGWAEVEIPLGWAICDGQKYILDENNVAVLDSEYGIQTPDLRGRFVLGSGTGENENNIVRSEKKLNEKGGEEKTTLKLFELPSHRHSAYLKVGLPIGHFNAFDRMGSRDVYSGGLDTDDTDILKNNAYPSNFTKFSGGDQPHYNVPPFYVLTYIMKI